MAQKHHRMIMKWLRPFFDLPAQPAKSLFFVKISKWPKLVNFHPIWFKLGMEVIYNPLNGKLTFGGFHFQADGWHTEMVKFES